MRLATLISISVFVSACVSVNIGNSGKNQKASNINFNEPQAPFSTRDRDDVDRAWKNEKNGNQISFLSDCNDPDDPPLDQVVQGVLSGLTELTFDATTVNHQGREARSVLAKGKVDGVPSQIELLVFKRNHCLYILSYIGVDSAFAADRDAFQSFKSGFKAP